MTDSTGILSETHSSSSANEPTETQLAQAGDQIQVSEPAVGTSIQLVAPGDGLQLGFDPADVAKAEVKDGNLEITFKNGAVAVVQGYEEWAAAGGQPTGPQGGVVDVAQLGQPAAPAVCELPGENVHVVDVPVPAGGERLTLAVAPGDALRLACSFRDVHGAEVGNNLEMTFPGGGVVVVENFSEWIAAQGSAISDCVCGGINPAEFIIALGLNPEDVLPAAGGEGPAGPLPDSPSFTPGQGPQILQGFDHPHILPPTALGYGLPGPDEGFFPVDDDDLGGPQANDDPPDALRDVLTVRESTRPAAALFALAAASGDSEGGEGSSDDGCVPPIGPQVFQRDETTFKVITNDTFGPDGGGNPPITAFHYNGDPSLVDNPDGVLVENPEGDKLVITSSSSDPDANQWHAELIINGPNAGQFTFFLDSTYLHEEEQGENSAFESFRYTIQDSDGDKASANVTVDIVDSIPIANNDCEICFTEPGVDAEVITPVTGNVMANDDLGADQFLPNGTKLISFTYDGGTETATVSDGGSTTVTTAIGGTLTVHSNGDWSYTPPANVDNTNGDVHDDFSYTIRDGDGDIDSATQPICIQDGAEPEAFDNKQCVNEGATQNVLIIADVSGSMITNPNDADPTTDGFQTRLDLEKSSLTALVDKYAALEGTVTITLIAFASGDSETPGGTDTDGALNLGTFTFSSTSDPGYAAAIAAIASLQAGLGPLDTATEYDDALLLAKDVLTGQLATQADGTTNTVYFLSDGDPNPDSNAADAPGVNWKAFVDGNNIEVIAVGIGSDVSKTELDKVEDNGDSAVIVDDQGDLAGLLTNAAGNASVSGNVLLDPTEELNISPANDPVGSVDNFGSDGAGTPKIISLTQGTDTFTPASTTLDNPDVISNDGHTIVIHTDLGGTLSFNFDTGAYTYTAPDVVDHGKSPEVDERFTYVIQDTDGDTDPADLVICIKDNVEPPEVTMAIGVDGNGACVEEDSKLGDPDNRVDVHAVAQADDTLTQLVITGLNNPEWAFDFNGLKGAGVDLGASEFDTSDGKITLVFNAGVKEFNGSFFVEPPADSDVDLGKLTATATAAAAGDPTQTLDSSTDINVTVDANADPVDITAFAVSDTGGDGSFSPNETGTLHIAATFGDSQDGSETHTVVVTVPSVFDVTNPAGGIVTANGDGSHTITFTLDTTGGSNDFSADVGIKATNGIGPQDYEFEATATATETTTGDTECDTTPGDNVASDTGSDTVPGADDQPIAYDNKQCVNEGATQNVLIIADVSGSMITNPNDADPITGGFQTRLDLEKSSLTALVDKYAALEGTVTITLIAFASGGPETPGGTDKAGALNLGTFTFSDTSDPGYAAAIAAIASLEAGMGPLNTATEYDDALLLAKDVLTGQLATQVGGTTNTVYFLSDGDPNPDTNAADAPGVDWKAFVDGNNIEVIAVGIGSDVSTTELDKVEDHTDKSVIVDDQGDLAGLLTNAAGNAFVSGNVLLDKTEEAGISPANDPIGSVDDFGDNGAGTPKIISLVHDGHTYDQTDVVGGEDGTVLDVSGSEITILTDLGGTLKFNFGTGDYTYTAPDVVDQGKNADVDERFTYTIQDSDGDTDPADLVICIKDNVEPPEVTMAIGVDGNGACVEEDSKLGDPDNRVDVHAEAQADDTLTQLVITGFNNEPGWSFDLNGLKGAGVNVGASEFDTSDGKITLVFNADVKVFDGSFFVQPPADSDIDLGKLTATATAAAAGDPTQTLDSSTNLNVTVDANADPVQVTAFAVNDLGGDGSFAPNETGTVHLTATFGDSQDGSETHTVTVNVPSVFDVTNPAGGVVTNNPDGSHTITFTLDTTGGSNDFAADIGIKATNAIAQQSYQFDATVQATETTTGDTECDTSAGDNIATDKESTTTQGFDDHPTAYDNKQCVNEGASANVLIIADVSGSMDDKDISPALGFQTRLDLEKSSLVALVDKYAALDGTVTITLIAFASGGGTNTPGGTDTNGARNLGTFTFDSTSDPGYAAAIAAVNSLAIGMQSLGTETEYDDALILAQNVLTTQLAGQTDGATNTVYFLSDGVPNPLSNGADATTWKTFVNGNNIEVVAVGIGNDVTTTELDKVEDNTDKSVIVDDQGDLAGLLTNIAGNASVSGNVLLDPTEEPNISPANDPVGSVDKFGNDGAGDPKIISLVHDGHTYDLADVVGGEGGTVLAKSGSEITIATDLGGTLTFNFATGDYTYTAPDKVQHGAPGSATDTEVDEVFTYTIQDKDGDTDPANLVICIQDGVPTAADDVNTVQESALDLNKDGIDLVAGLVVGSNPSSKAETVTGNLMGNDSEGPDGATITAIKFNGSDVTDASDGKLDGFIDVNTGHSALHVNATTGEYVYTLFDKTSGDGVKDVFSYTLTDGDGDQAKANLTVSIVDDVPTANDDTDSIGAGGKATGNVITGVGTTNDGPGDDVTGADGATVTDVDFGGTDGAPGVGIAGLFGTLILNADGSYEYQAKANVTGKDVFTYTLTDGDGDSDPATLTINVGASTPSVAPATDEVHEASLDTNKDGLDLVSGKVTGSNPADTDETETGKLVFSDPDGASITKITFNAVDTLAVGGFIDVDTGHGKLHVNAATGDYTYTLYDKTSGNTVHDDFGYTVTDSLGNAASSTLTVNIVDDVPTANDDKDSVDAGGKATGNVITGESTSTDGAGDDVKGADGATVTDVDFGATDGTPGVGIAGLFGTLILNADGSYEYQAKANVSGKDVFTYTLTDGDGDVDTATLTIDVGASTPVVNPAANAVNEAALDLSKDGKDLAGGTTTGSNPGSTGETVQGTLSFSDPDGASISKITFNGTDFTDAGDGKADGIINVNTPLGLLAVDSTSGAYTYTLETNSLKHTTQGTGIDGVNESFTYTVADKLGNSNSSSLVISVQDDVPLAKNNTANTADVATQTVNLVIVFDRSGSMADDPNVPGYSSRLELAKAAVAALFEAYDSVSTQLNIKIVDFSTTADHSVWLSSPEAANAYLAALSADGTTNYAGANGAIPELLNNYNTAGDPLPTADRTEVYFISDGKPNPSTTTLSGSTSVVTTAQWETFLNNNNVDNAFAIGVGNGLDVNDVDLGRISFPNGDAGVEPNRIIVVNEGQLLATLIGTVTTPVSGNVLTDAPVDVFGADGKGNGGVGLVSIAFNGHTYTYNQAANEIRNEANVLVASGAVLALDTTLGGDIEFHFDTGAYTYTPPNVASPQVENFTYTIVDGDGDKSSATLTVNISDAGGNVVTPLTHIGTNGNDNFNDSAAAADIIMSGGLGHDTLIGGAHNDHIQGGTGNDSLDGGLGIDILIGGPGNDTMVAGTGDSVFSGETSASGQFGSDLIILKDNVNFGHVDGGFSSSSDLSGSNRGDVLAFNGTLNLTTLANSKVEGIETISMKDSEGGAGNDTLTLNASDVIDLGTGHFNPSGSFNPSGPTDFGNLDDKAAIKVDGEAGDTLNLSGGGWFNAGASPDHGAPAGYTLYVHDAGGGNEDAHVLVQTVVAVTGAS